MCILTFWLSVSFLSLAHTCFRTTYAWTRACVCVIFIWYIFLFSSFPRCVSPHISSPTPLHSTQTGFIYSRPVSALVLLSRRLCPRFFFPIIAPPACAGRFFSSLLRPFFPRPHCSPSSSSSSRHPRFCVRFSKILKLHQTVLVREETLWDLPTPALHGLGCTSS